MMVVKPDGMNTSELPLSPPHPSFMCKREMFKQLLSSRLPLAGLESHQQYRRAFLTYFTFKFDWSADLSTALGVSLSLGPNEPDPQTQTEKT